MDSQTLLGIIISGSNQEFGFERQYGNVIRWTGNSPRFRTSFGIAKNPFFESIRIEGQRNTTVKATYGLFDYDFFIKVLKETLIFVLLVVFVAVITLVIELNLKAKSSRASRRNSPFVSSFTEPHTTRIIRDEDEEVEESENNDSMFPKGLYSPRGIGWESYTKERLESELHRAAASEEDLVFIAMQTRNVQFGEEDFRKLADAGVKFFTQRDMIFEKGEQGMSFIIPGITLDQGLIKSERFRRHIQSSMQDASGTAPDFYLGLSSRAGRLVEAERLILEASEALSKALKDPKSSIIAFRSNPDKYREYVSRNKAS
jgi:hypothetical protein